VSSVSSEPISIFGEADPISLAVADGISAHGRRAHLISAETGVLSPARESIADADTASGAAALRSLREDDGADAVVVISSADRGRDSVASVRHMCWLCADRRGVAVLWHESGVEPERLAEEVVRRIENPAPAGELVETWMSDGS
jgi:hypothetical protein